MLAVLGTDLEVPLVDGRKVRYANLDYAATAPCARAAADAVAELLPVLRQRAPRRRRPVAAAAPSRTSRPAQTVGRLPRRPARTTRWSSPGTPPTRSTCWPGACRRARTVVTFAGEHHANLLPWPAAVRLPTARLARRRRCETLDAALACAALRGPDRWSRSPARSNVTGELLAGDGARPAVAHRARRPDRGRRRPARAARTGGPHRPGRRLRRALRAQAVRAVRRRRARRPRRLARRGPAVPGRRGCDRRPSADATHDVRWQTGAARHEAGTPNLLGAVALAAVCAGPDAADRAVLHAREQELLARSPRVRAGCRRRRSAPSAPARPRVGIVSFVVGRPSGRGGVATDSPSRHGIGVRDGLFCAHPLTRRLLRGRPAPHRAATAVRASIGHGSTDEHVDRLLGALVQRGRLEQAQLAVPRGPGRGSTTPSRSNSPASIASRNGVGPARARCRAGTGARAWRQVEPVLGPGQPDEEQPPLLGDVVLGRRAPGQRSGSSPSSQPTRNTTGNSRPFAACRVSSVTASARGSSASTSAPVASCLQELRPGRRRSAAASGSQQVDRGPDVARRSRPVRRRPASGAAYRWASTCAGQLAPGAAERAAAAPPAKPQLAGDRRDAGPVAQPVVRALLHRDAGPGQRLDDRRRPARRCGRARRCRRTTAAASAPRASRPGRSRATGATGRRPARRSYAATKSASSATDAGRVHARPAAPPGRAGPGRAGGPVPATSARSPARRRRGSARTSGSCGSAAPAGRR